jgi:hypothetical protein
MAADFMLLIDLAIFAVVIARAAVLLREEKVVFPHSDVVQASVEQRERFFLCLHAVATTPAGWAEAVRS